MAPETEERSAVGFSSDREPRCTATHTLDRSAGSVPVEVTHFARNKILSYRQWKAAVCRLVASIGAFIHSVTKLVKYRERSRFGVHANRTVVDFAQREIEIP